jgi:hypothetical protein
MTAKVVPNRREQFRQFMTSLTTGGVPSRAIEQGLYVPAPSSVVESLVPRIDLRPASSHLVVGGIGTGKTTQLLMAQVKLRQIPDVEPLYLDVSAHHDLEQLSRGVLIVIAGVALDKLLTSLKSDAERPTRKEFNKWAAGYTTWYEDDSEGTPYDGEDPFDEPRHYAVQTPAVLVPPEPPLDTEIASRLTALNKLVAVVQAETKKSHIVFLIDSMDRVTKLDAFLEVVVHDVRALKDANVGVVVVGPLRVLFGANRPITDRFDSTYHISAVDTNSKEGPDFLANVLRLRAPSELLREATRAALVRLSGGVLRDLIRLTQASAEEAYVKGSSFIATEHVAIAADAFGRNLMLGLDAEELAVLQRVRKDGTFVQTSDKEVALLMTRRVLEYEHNRFAVHPTIEQLLIDLEGR